MFKKIAMFKVENASTVIKEIKDRVEEFSNFKFNSPSSTEKKRMGFSHTGFNFEEYVSVIDHNIILKITTQEKKPNKNEINHLIREKTQEYLKDNPQEENVSKELAKIFKEEMEDKVLRETFPSEEKHSFVIIRPNGQILVEGSVKQAEDILALIRKTIGSLPAVSYEPEGDVLDMLKARVKDDVCDTITLGQKANLIDVNENEYKAKGALGGCSKVAAILKEDTAIVTSVEVSREYIKKVMVDEDLTFTGITFDKEFTEDEESEEASLILQMNEVFLLIDDVVNRLKEEG